MREARNGEPSLVSSLFAARTGWDDARNDASKTVMFASGELVPDEVVDTVVRECDRRKIEFVWEPGDVLMIDNSVTMHARNPFEGASRRILASMRGRPVLAPFHADAQKRVVLPSWDAMPTTAFGCWKLRDPEQAVYNAIRTGYRHIDAASDYGNEEAIGRGIRRAIDEKLAVREDLFVTSKLWGTDHREARGACKRSLRNMGLDCFDMYMIHFPIALDPRFTSNGWSRDDGGGMTTDRVPLHATWARMEGLVRDGLVRNVGVCNFNCVLLSDLLSYANISPAVLQVELHPHNAQTRLLRWCRAKGIHVAATESTRAGSFRSPFCDRWPRSTASKSPPCCSPGRGRATRPWSCAPRRQSTSGETCTRGSSWTPMT